MASKENELVEVVRKQAVTTSLKVAEIFEKRHKNVVRDIDEIIEEMASEPESSKLSPREMFRETTYQVEGNFKEYPMYYINRDGFTLLAMGFTGKKALQFKLAYINAFNEMERRLLEIEVNHRNNDWVAAREESKRNFRKMTQAIKERVIPLAREQGSTAPDQIFYVTYAKMLNKSGNIPAGNRERLTFTQLSLIDQIEDVATRAICAYSQGESTHKDVYQKTKNAVESFSRIALAAERFQLE